MQEFFGSVWWLIFSLGVLITFHEFGHYWVARRCGVKVLRFSVGFGRPLWKRTGRDGTEWVIAAIPLGGYVKMLDEREDDVPPAQRDQAFNLKPVGQRFAIVAAGPIFNLILCVFLLWGMFLIGKTDYAPVIGEVEGIAADAGLAPNDRIIAVAGQPAPTWTHAVGEILIAAVDRRAVTLDVRSAQGPLRSVDLDLSALPADFDQGRPFEAIGLKPRHWNPEAVVGSVEPGTAAEQAGVQPGDRILAIGDTPIPAWAALTPTLAAASRGGAAVRLTIERGGFPRELQVRPAREVHDGEERWILGVRAAEPEQALLRYGPLEAVPAALRETWTFAGNTLGLLRRMLTGEASLRNISGPITIAQVANTTANIGPDWFLSFLALLSLSLCIMNLLPIPILDGGHLLYYTVEMAKGSPVSDRVMEAGQFVGLALLAGLMGLAFYNDILRLVSS